MGLTELRIRQSCVFTEERQGCLNIVALKERA